MGFEPLPFDPMSPCLCHQNCPNFKRVTSRYWARIFGFDVEPRLAEGVLVELDPGSTSQGNCIWTAVIPFVFPKSFTVLMRHFPPGASLKINWEVDFSIFLLPPDYLAVRTDPQRPCSRVVLDVFKISGPELWQECELTRIEWWQNANDVVH